MSKQEERAHEVLMGKSEYIAKASTYLAGEVGANISHRENITQREREWKEKRAAETVHPETDRIRRLGTQRREEATDQG